VLLRLYEGATTAMLVEVGGGRINEDDDLGIVELDSDVIKALEMLLS